MLPRKTLPRATSAGRGGDRKVRSSPRVSPLVTRRLAALLALAACGRPPPAPPPDAAPPTELVSDVPQPVESATAPRPQDLPQSPGCDEILVPTICGDVVRCSTNHEERAVLRAGAVVRDDPCLAALRGVRGGLRALAKEPLEQSPVWSHPTCLPDEGARATAYAAIVAQVRREGIARVQAWSTDPSDPGKKAYWTTLLRERFDLRSLAPSCKNEHGFFVEAHTDVGAPGSLPYWGLFRAGADGRRPRKIVELSDVQPANAWWVGDLDGDGVSEVVVRSGLREGTSQEKTGGRYRLASIALPEPLFLLERPDELRNEALDVVGVELPSGWVVLVGGRVVVLRAGAIEDAPGALRGELEAKRKKARARVQALLERLERPLAPSPSACAEARLAETLSLALDLRRLGLGGLRTAASLTGTKDCLAWPELEG